MFFDIFTILSAKYAIWAGNVIVCICLKTLQLFKAKTDADANFIAGCSKYKLTLVELLLERKRQREVEH